ncbi:alpha/beta hydrolase [Singulisphaera sp. PoT]|uniref:alpha/beta hydrolase n=1 Tax=Singulisphaera sp. PoT TaxID=3411797 RepID=UPI003BF57A84
MDRLSKFCLAMGLAALIGGGDARAQESKTGNADGASLVIPVWPGDAPGSEGWTQKELEYRNEWDKKAMVRNVVRPTLTAYLPDPAKATGAAVIVCPGGGFKFLSWQSEGTEVAEWLRDRGVAAFVLRYRLNETPAGEDEFRKEMVAFMGRIAALGERRAAAASSSRPGEAPRPPELPEEMKKIAPLAMADGKQAIKVVRQHADEWGIKKDRVGIIGFSAGGMVTMMTALGKEPETRPDFAAPIYGGDTGGNPAPADAPPLFILCASDDDLAAAGSLRVYEAWKAAKRPAELHLYEKGGHGFGMNKRGLPVDRWIERYGDWLSQRGLIVDPASIKK